MDADGAPPLVIDLELDRFVDPDAALLDPAEMDRRSPSFFWVSVTRKRPPPAVRMMPVIADLAAGLGIERRLVQHQRPDCPLSRTWRSSPLSPTMARTTPSAVSVS